ncbi:YcnI family protein [Micromonospora sp. NPDC093277]|uniref:YcnI family copper-binding membrane protein n=1 Tax=Micromonospora sp. NPDC093277 TaxID=3364291 RepID=UPI0038277DE9
MLRRVARTLVTAGAAACLVGVLPAAAFAHVTVNPGTATQGGYAALTFRVPTESDDASTTRIEVQFPTESPLASISVKPHPGWSYEITKTKLATPIEVHGAQISEIIEKITWTAADPQSAIKPGEYDEFSVSAGPLPTTDQLAFKTLQHYSDGEVVRWIQEPAPGADEPDRPAPVLRLVPKENGTASPSAGTEQAALAADSATTQSDAGVRWAVGLSTASLVIGLLCAAIVVRSRRADKPQRSGGPTTGGDITQN